MRFFSCKPWVYTLYSTQHNVKGYLKPQIYDEYVIHPELDPPMQGNCWL